MDWRTPNLVARLIGIGLILATVFNGAGFYLRKTGLVEPEKYRAYWALHCGLESPDSVFAGPGCCGKPSTAEERAIERAYTRYLYETPGYEILLKLVKDALGIGVIVMSAYLLWRRKAPVPDWRLIRWPGWLAGVVAIAFLGSAINQGFWTAASGIRSFLFLGIALVGLWLARQMDYFARCAGVLIVVQLLLLPFELFKGIHLHGHFAGLLLSRMSGTLMLPNSLGVFAVAALAFYYAFSQSRTYLIGLTIATLVIVVVAGSATGILSLAVFLWWLMIERTAGRARAAVVVAGGLATALLLSALPEITGRPIFNSLIGYGGRLDRIWASFSERGVWETVLGSGLGVGTNALANLTRSGMLDLRPPMGGLSVISPDSTIAALVWQIGFLGATLFYGFVGWAFWKDPAARLFYFMIALTSL
ncbi:hypothetical protein, partial [Candidatus Methylomirabilis sp.]|uniref:hypothetical protein n=1 Tax=Candidatus Methylomirabilis sp. TaxID=2032687 RepID=UPI003C71D4F1